jgi:sporulation protein YlmC with PRC-barrel domain
LQKFASFRGLEADFHPNAWRIDMDISELWRKPLKMAAIAAAIAVALGTSAQQSEQPPRENANRPPAETQIARSDAGMQTLEQYLQSKALRVSKVVGMELQARNGDNLGEVEDVIRATAPGQDMQLIVQIGGVGADQKFIALPFDEIQIDSDGDELYTNRTGEQLAAAPAVDLDRRTGTVPATPAQRSAAEANRDAANRGAAPAPGAAGGEPRTTQPAAPGGQRSAPSAASLSQNRLGDLAGAEVTGSGGDKVGEVDDVVISTAGADSVRAVLQVGGLAGVGEKRVAVPVSQLMIERDEDGEPTLRIAMDVDALERLPEFEYEEQTSAL